MCRIIFFDIDGTLRDEAYGIPDTAKNAIERSREKGAYVCLCTGRTVGTIHDDVLGLNVDGVIAGGGSYIEFKDKIYKNHHFDSSKIRELKLYLDSRRENVAFAFETGENVFMNLEAVKIFNALNEEKFKLLDRREMESIIENQKIVYEENMYKFNTSTNKVSKICLWSTKDTYEEVENILSSNEIQIAQSFRFDDRYYYEIIQTGCDKGQAIVELCSELDIPLKETLAFGDGRNDIDMLKTVGIAIGVENGSKEIFEYVDSICEEPMKDGIYLELKRRNII